eukprot:5982179-Pyramimonas_sp.AAC.1
MALSPSAPASTAPNAGSLIASIMLLRDGSQSGSSCFGSGGSPHSSWFASPPPLPAPAPTDPAASVTLTKTAAKTVAKKPATAKTVHKKPAPKT